MADLPPGYVEDVSTDVPAGYVEDTPTAAASAPAPRPPATPAPAPTGGPLATPDQLTPDQQQRFLRELQVTPLNPNPPAEQGVGRRALGGLLQPFTGLAAGLEKGGSSVASALGAAGAADTLQRGAENSYLFGAKTDPGVVSGAARMVGALPEMLAGGAGAIASGANEASNQLMAASMGNQPIDMKTLTQSLASGGADAAFNYLLGKGVSGPIAKDVIRMLPEALGATGEKVVGRAATGAGLGAGSQVIQNLIAGRPWNEGIKEAAGQMGAMEVAGGTAHDIAGKLLRKPVPAPEATPAAPPTEEPAPRPAVTQAETAPQAPEQAAPPAARRPGGAVSSRVGSPSWEADMQQNDPVVWKLWASKLGSSPEQSAAQLRRYGPDVITAAHDRLMGMYRSEGSQPPADFTPTVPTAGAGGPEPTAASAPAELPNAKAVGDWYGKTFNDESGGPIIESLAGAGGDEKYVLRDIPPQDAQPGIATPGDTDTAKVDRLAALSPDERAALKPIILTHDLQPADGHHRLLAAQQAGDATIKAYVPESVAKAKGWEPAGQPAAPAPAAPEGTPFQRRTLGNEIQTKAQQWKQGVGDAWKAANRLLGTGLGVEKTEKGIRSRLIATGSQIDADRTVLEQAFKGDRDTMDSWSPQAKTTWIEQIEAGQPSTDPKMQPTADAIQAMNKSLRTRAEAVGIDTARWNPDDDWIGRLAEFPATATKGTGTSLSGPETFLKRRDIETFGQFKKAVEDAGGRLKYDNPLDMTLAKLAEVNKSVTAREFLKGEEGRGTVRRVAAGQELPEGWGYINDKLSTDRGNQYAAHPKYLKTLNDTSVPAAKRISQFQQLRDSGELTKLSNRTAKTSVFGEGGDLQAIQKQAQLAEGTGPTPFPAGHGLVDPLLSQVADKGQLAAPQPVADMLNQFVAPGLPRGSIFDRVAEVTRLTTLANFSLSAFHAATTGASNAILGVQQALDNVLHGEFATATKNAIRAFNPIGEAARGRAVREQLAGLRNQPELAPLAEAIKQSGAKSGTPTILVRSDWQKALNAYRQGKSAEAGARFGKAVLGSTTDLIMNRLVPNMKIAALSRAAETATERGLTGDALREYMQQASRVTDNVAGHVVRSNQFQHRVVQNVLDIVMSAPKFAEGAVRVYGGATVDTLKGLADVATGKAPRITANQQVVMAHLLTHALAAGATQAILTAVNGEAQLPSSVKDFWYPRTGRKNTDGSDERLQLPDPLGAIPAMLHEGPTKAFVNRVNPVWRAIGDVITNSDYRNVKVRSGNALEQTAESIGHVAKAALPWSVQQAAQPANPNQAEASVPQRASAFLGVRTAPPSLSQSDAEQMAHDFSAENVGGAAREPTEADRAAMIGALANAMRNKEPDARTRINQAIEDGVILPADRAQIMQRASGPKGLAGQLRHSSLTPDQLVQVWDAATDEERPLIRGVILGRIMRSTTLDNTKRGELRRHIMEASQ